MLQGPEMNIPMRMSPVMKMMARMVRVTDITTVSVLSISSADASSSDCWQLADSEHKKRDAKNLFLLRQSAYR